MYNIPTIQRSTQNWIHVFRIYFLKTFFPRGPLTRILLKTSFHSVLWIQYIVNLHHEHGVAMGMLCTSRIYVWGLHDCFFFSYSRCMNQKRLRVSTTLTLHTIHLIHNKFLRTYVCMLFLKHHYILIKTIPLQKETISHVLMMVVCVLYCL